MKLRNPKAVRDPRMGRWALPAAVACVCLLGIAIHSSATPQATQSVHITLMGTTDLHAHIEPVDYFTNKPAALGLAKIATLIRAVRKEQPNSLLLDAGDTIQGTPLGYYFVKDEPGKPNPVILAMNALGYDAAAVGNHEFNFGLEYLWKVKGEAHYPILAANVKQSYASGVKHFDPYAIKNVAGVRVALVGFVTQSIPHWEIPANYKGYEFEPIVDAARRVIPEARKQADVVVVIAHSGLGPDPDDKAPPEFIDIPGENQVLELANQVPGIDVILFGHTHSQLAERTVNGVLLTQPKNFGGSLARIDLDVARGVDGHYQISSKHSTVIPVTPDTPVDPQVAELAAPYEQATQTYLDTPVATSAKEMSGATARIEDEPLTDLIHTVQLEAGHADISMATMLFTGVRIPAGKVTTRQLAALYIYENTLYTVEMTGAQFRNALEHAAGVFQQWPLPAGEQLHLPNYDVDSAAGVNYTINLRQPLGHRIADLTYKGKPLDDSQKFHVAINNYRYAGGGRYDIYKGLPVTYRSTQEVRELIADYLRRTGVVPGTANNNWHIEPKEAADALRKLALDQQSRATSATLGQTPKVISPATSRITVPGSSGQFPSVMPRSAPSAFAVAGN
jgi:2',3'-cyclic-nucleotide 2'-phosphodiesterase/3'-nucleotidase